jgi:hypothetical protein
VSARNCSSILARWSAEIVDGCMSGYHAQIN